jgi:hypothetical protein
VTEGAYSEVADRQLDTLEAGDDADLYNAVLDVCELILATPGDAQRSSAVVTTDVGLRFRLAVPGHYPYKVFWSRTEDGPRIEAVFPYS